MLPRIEYRLADPFASLGTHASVHRKWHLHRCFDHYRSVYRQGTSFSKQKTQSRRRSSGGRRGEQLGESQLEDPQLWARLHGAPSVTCRRYVCSDLNPIELPNAYMLISFYLYLIRYLLRVHPSHCNTGYFSRVARLDPDGQYTTLHGGLRVEPHSLSTCGRYAARPEWVLYEDIVDGGKFQIAFPAAVVCI